MNSIGTIVRKLREAQGLTQETLAANAGIATRVLQRIESGKANTKIGTLEAIATALGTDLGALVPGTVSFASPPPSHPKPDEIAALGVAFALSSPGRRLLALYILTRDDSYYREAAAIPDVALLARALKKSLLPS